MNPQSIGVNDMCYGMGCQYERKWGPNAGECSVGAKKPMDAVCMDEPELFPNCEECDNGAFTECDGHCMTWMVGGVDV